MRMLGYERVRVFCATVAALGLLSVGCGVVQPASSIDPKAPMIRLKGLEPPPLETKSGVAVVKTHQPYRLIADVVWRDGPIVKAERRLSWSGGPWPSGSIGFSPVDLTNIANCCAWAFTSWYFSVPNEGSGQIAEVEMWVVDAEGRASNVVKMSVVSR